MAAECQRRLPFNDRRGVGAGGPLWNSVHVKRMDEGKEKVEGSRNQCRPVSQGPLGDLVWALTRNTSILTLRRGERLVSLNGTAISKHGEACKSSSSDRFL